MDLPGDANSDVNCLSVHHNVRHDGAMLANKRELFLQGYEALCRQYGYVVGEDMHFQSQLDRLENVDLDLHLEELRTNLQGES